MKSLSFHALATAAALVAACAIAGSPMAIAASPAKAEAHDHAASVFAKLSLDHGRKWATDESDGRQGAEDQAPAGADAGRIRLQQLWNLL
jgi:hypothetical protein